MNFALIRFKERAMKSFAAYFRLTTIVVLFILIFCAQSAMAQTASGVTVSPAALSYGVPSGSTFAIAPATAPASAPESVTVNITCSATPCSSVTFTGASIGASSPALNTDNPADFVINGAPSCSGTLTSPNTCQVSVYYNAGLAPATTLETAGLTISSSVGNLTVQLSGAYGSIKLFDETNITGNGSPYTIASKQLNLTCPLSVSGAVVPPTATISGTPDGKGNVLIDNYVTLATGPSLTPVNSATPAGNLCPDGDCFTFNYEDALFNEPAVVVNADPDTFANGNSILPHDDPSNGAGGVGPINIQSFLMGNPPGVPLYPEQALFTLSSDADPAYYGNSTLFLQTNCTAPGIIPGASVTLNPTNTSNPATLTQTADLDNSPGQNISFTTSSAVANQQIPTLVNNGVVQVITDYPVPQQLFSQLVTGTSAGPSVCMRLAGEQDSNGNPMCKGFLLQCYTPGASGSAGTPSGDNCYNAGALTETAQRYLLFTSQFTSPDGPSGYNFLTNQDWVASNAYTVGQTIVDQSGDVQQVTTAGTSGSGLPIFLDGIVDGVPATTLDGSVIWTFQGVNACLNVPNGASTPVPTICAKGTGPGLLMGGDNWLCPTDEPCTPPTTSVSTTTPTSPATYSAASCAFDSGGGLNGDLCPLDVMTSFQGAADAAPKGTSKITNSLFIPVVNQPLPSATEAPGSGFTGQWTNAPASATISFTANPASYPSSGAVPGFNGFRAASIYSVTGGLTAFGQPLPDTTYPVTGDYSALNSGVGASVTSPFCPSTPTTSTFSTSPTLVNLNNQATPVDGIYNVHYFATDCALTEGLVYSPTPAEVTNATANWASFPFATVGVDTVAPTATCSQTPSGPTPSGWYGSNVTVNCSVTDQDFNSNPESGPLTGSGFAPAVNGIQGSQSETVTAVTSVAAGSVSAAATTGSPTPSPCDQAGNCPTGIPTGPFMIDLQAPTVTTSGTPYSSTVGGPAISVSFTCNDGMGSGIQACNISGTPSNFVPNTPFCSPSSGEVVTCGGTIPTTGPESGTLTISATDNVGNAAQAVMVPFTVNQEPLTITASNTAFTFGGTAPTPTALYTYGSLVQSATAPAGLTAPNCTTTATSTTPVGTDTGANTCSGAAGSNYAISYAAGNAVVSAEPLTITASNTAFTFGGTPPVPTALYSYGSVVQSATVPGGVTAPSCTTTATSTTPVGTDTGANTCSGAAGSNYAINYVAGNAVVGAEPLTITASNTAYTFGSAPPAPTPLYTYGSVIQSATAPAGLTRPSCTTTATSTTPVGTDTGANTCSGASSSNYSISYVAGSAVVSAESLVITASNTSFTQGNTPPTPTPLYTYGTISLSSVTPVGLTPPICTTTVTSATGPGAYPGANTCSGALGSNYSIGYVSGTATVSAPTISLRVSPQSLTFGSSTNPLYAWQDGIPQFITVTNTGSSPVVISSATVGGTNSNDFGDLSFCTKWFSRLPGTLPAGASCEIGVDALNVAPPPAGSASPYVAQAYLAITPKGGSAIDVPLTVYVINPVASVSSSRLAFPTTKTGNTSELSITVTNAGTTPLVFGTPRTNGGPFAIAAGTTCTGATIEPSGVSGGSGTSCVINVTFSPSKAGSFSGVLSIFDNARNSPQGISLSGTE
jgi:hypothetical protein